MHSLRRRASAYILLMSFFALCGTVSFALTAYAQTTAVVSPATVLQGDPVMIQLPGTSRLADVDSISYNGTSLTPFLYQNTVTTFASVPLTQKAGDYPLKIALANGQIINQTITVNARNAPPQPLGIPAKLGGNTKKSAKRLVSTLEKDNVNLAKITTAPYALWATGFTMPVTTPIVTDAYGYVRQTNGYSIAHLGTDFHAPLGTPIMAMNDGIVVKSRYYTVYGNTIVIDHGLGVSTYYMHLSKMNVHLGDRVTKGEVIGLSGTTGYSEGPHVHISVHIKRVSIDPAEFLAFFK